MQYTQDYDEQLPPARNSTTPFTNAPWHFLIQPYVKSYQLFKCPSNTAKNVIQDTTGAAPLAAGVPAAGIPISYQANAGVGGNFTNTDENRAMRWNTNKGTHMAKFNFPATTIVVHEQAGGEYEPFAYNTGKIDGNGKNGQGDWYAFTNHLATSNYFFMDGHVKTLKPSSTCNASINMWAIDNVVQTYCRTAMGSAEAFLVTQ